MHTIRAVMQAARPDDVRPEHLPVLPLWWPLDPPAWADRKHTDDSGCASSCSPGWAAPSCGCTCGHLPLALTDEQRAAGRHAAALKEARRGPSDGTVGEVVVFSTGPPALLRVYDGGWAYRLQSDESVPENAVYRYSPADSPQHLSTMLVVAEAYVETGPDYTLHARTDEAVHDGITMTAKED